MTTEPVAPPAAPARELVPLAIAALLAAVAALVCYGVLFSTLDRQPGQRLPIEVLYLPLAVLAGAAWIKTSLKVSAVLGALAGALYGLTLGFLILGGIAWQLWRKTRAGAVT